MPGKRKKERIKSGKPIYMTPLELQPLDCNLQKTTETVNEHPVSHTPVKENQVLSNCHGVLSFKDGFPTPYVSLCYCLFIYCYFEFFSSCLKSRFVLLTQS